MYNLNPQYVYTRETTHYLRMSDSGVAIYVFRYLPFKLQTGAL